MENCGGVPESVTADSGYVSEANVVGAASMGIDAYVATGRLKHGEELPPVSGRMP